MAALAQDTRRTLRGAALLRAAIDHIIAHPDSWDQTIIWHSPCGTRHCLFGLCQILAGLEPNHDDCFAEVRDLLGICTPDAAWLCAHNRTLDQIRWFADELTAGRVGVSMNGYVGDGCRQEVEYGR